MPPSSSTSKCALTDNEGDSTENEEETAADYNVRGAAGLVTAACPREYPRNFADRKRLGIMIPADFDKDAFVEMFKRLMTTNSNRKLLRQI